MVRGWTTFAGLVVALAAAPAAAQTVTAPNAAAARQKFDTGLIAMEAGNLNVACPLLDQSYKLDPRPGTLFTLAECEAKRGRLATAVARYNEYLVLWERLPPAQRAKQLDRDKVAAAQKAALARQIPELTLSIPKDAPPGTIVKRDDMVLDALSLGTALPIDPGEHIVITQAPGFPETVTKVTLTPGDRKVIVLEVKAAAPEPPPSNGRRTAAFVSFGIGAASIGVSLVAGGVMISKRGAIKDGCHNGPQPNVKLCTPEGAAAGEAAKAFGTAGTASFLLGIVGLGLGTTLLLTAPKPDAKPAASAASIKIGALAVGPEGVVLGAQGVW